MKKRILVIDDDSEILDAFKFILLDVGYKVKILTKDGVQVQQSIKSFHPDLIILDVLLPGSNGRTLCEKLKTNTDTQHIPIIMISAHPSAGKTVMKYGADVFISKPFNVDDILKVIDSFL